MPFFFWPNGPSGYFGQYPPARLQCEHPLCLCDQGSIEWVEDGPEPLHIFDPSGDDQSIPCEAESDTSVLQPGCPV